MRLVIARCTVDYLGRLTAHLPSARRLLLFKADGSVSVHADDRAYKPLNWMSPPCWFAEELDGTVPVWVVQNKAGEQLRITVEDIEHDSSHELGLDPGLVKDGVEAHLQALLAEHVQLAGCRLHVGASRIHDADRAGRPVVPRRTRGAQSRSRSSAAGKSTASSSSPVTWICSTGTVCWRR